MRELRWDGVDDAKIVVLSYWNFVTEATIKQLYPEGFTGWDLEHGGVLETSLMLALFPHLVQKDKAVDHPPGVFLTENPLPTEFRSAGLESPSAP